ncbi:hypothetical protein [Terribacillus saccharophilus]|uniref:hypothetical protein n=1 Tax=Terribacillus saccharophilus TaxID=361277 RepID=UPI002989B982|nr:hypothetical protein [Terribacillus saccharophilus]MCM3226324.1 hypothetical protein [Terribacillus saccharophilus]
MAKLLVLSLAETTRDKDSGYAVIARNLDDESWVIIPTLPKELFLVEEEYAWDIFAITEADIVRKFDNRNEVYYVNQENYLPYMIEPPIKSNRRRKWLLDNLSTSSIEELQNNSSWVGIIRNPQIDDLMFSERKQDTFGYDINQTFYWECRLDFHDEFNFKWNYRTAPGVAVKDMRFKAYWRDVMISRRDYFLEKKIKWISYMQENDTYLLVEFYPNDFLGSVAVISGVISINKREMRRG